MPTSAAEAQFDSVKSFIGLCCFTLVFRPLCWCSQETRPLKVCENPAADQPGEAAGGSLQLANSSGTECFCICFMSAHTDLQAPKKHRRALLQRQPREAGGITQRLGAELNAALKERHAGAGMEHPTHSRARAVLVGFALKLVATSLPSFVPQQAKESLLLPSSQLKLLHTVPEFALGS